MKIKLKGLVFVLILNFVMTGCVDNSQNMPIVSETVKVDEVIVDNYCKVEEWHMVYNAIIKEISDFAGKEKVFFKEIFALPKANLADDEWGGVSEGYPISKGEFVFYLKDITIDGDGIPELFIGLKNDKTMILAVYTYDAEKSIAKNVSVVSQNYTSEIYLCKNNLLLEGNANGGELVAVGNRGRMPFSNFRKEQDEKTIIKTENIEWLMFSEWKD